MTMLDCHYEEQDFSSRGAPCPKCGTALDVITDGKTGATKSAYCRQCKKVPFTEKPPKPKAKRSRKKRTTSRK